MFLGGEDKQGFRIPIEVNGSFYYAYRKYVGSDDTSPSPTGSDKDFGKVEGKVTLVYDNEFKKSTIHLQANGELKRTDSANFPGSIDEIADHVQADIQREELDKLFNKDAKYVFLIPAEFKWADLKKKNYFLMRGGSVKDLGNNLGILAGGKLTLGKIPIDGSFGVHWGTQFIILGDFDSFRPDGDGNRHYQATIGVPIKAGAMFLIKPSSEFEWGPEDDIKIILKGAIMFAPTKNAEELFISIGGGINCIKTKGTDEYKWSENGIDWEAGFKLSGTYGEVGVGFTRNDSPPMEVENPGFMHGAPTTTTTVTSTDTFAASASLNITELIRKAKKKEDWAKHVAFELGGAYIYYSQKQDTLEIAGYHENSYHNFMGTATLTVSTDNIIENIGSLFE